MFVHTLVAVYGAGRAILERSSLGGLSAGVVWRKPFGFGSIASTGPLIADSLPSIQVVPGSRASLKASK